MLVEQFGDAGCGADGDGGLDRDDCRPGQERGQLADGVEEVGEVVGAVGLLGGAHADEVEVGDAGGLGVGGGEPQLAKGSVLGEEAVEATTWPSDFPGSGKLV